MQKGNCPAKKDASVIVRTFLGASAPLKCLQLKWMERIYVSNGRTGSYDFALDIVYISLSLHTHRYIYIYVAYSLYEPIK